MTRSKHARDEALKLATALTICDKTLRVAHLHAPSIRPYVENLQSQRDALSRPSYRWTREHVCICKQAIHSFWVCNRPLHSMMRPNGPPREAFKVWFEEQLSARRQEIVLSEIRSLRNVFAARIESERAAGLEDEAKADERAVSLSNALVELIQLHGLPPEVYSYDPRS